jgi:hypothetical protein
VKRLNSSHTNEDGQHFPHEDGTLASLGPLRTFRFRWIQEGGRRELILREQADGTFNGSLTYPGGEEDVMASVGGGPDGPWRLTVSRSSGGQQRNYDITAAEDEDEASPGKDATPDRLA